MARFVDAFSFHNTTSTQITLTSFMIFPIHIIRFILDAAYNALHTILIGFVIFLSFSLSFLLSFLFATAILPILPVFYFIKRTVRRGVVICSYLIKCIYLFILLFVRPVGIVLYIFELPIRSLVCFQDVVEVIICIVCCVRLATAILVWITISARYVACSVVLTGCIRVYVLFVSLALVLRSWLVIFVFLVVNVGGGRLDSFSI